MMVYIFSHVPVYFLCISTRALAFASFNNKKKGARCFLSISMLNSCNKDRLDKRNPIGGKPPWVTRVGAKSSLSLPWYN